MIAQWSECWCGKTRGPRFDPLLRCLNFSASPSRCQRFLSTGVLWMVYLLVVVLQSSIYKGVLILSMSWKYIQPWMIVQPFSKFPLMKMYLFSDFHGKMDQLPKGISQKNGHPLWKFTSTDLYFKRCMSSSTDLYFKRCMSSKSLDVKMIVQGRHPHQDFRMLHKY